MRARVSEGERGEGGLRRNGIKGEFRQKQDNSEISFRLEKTQDEERWRKYLAFWVGFYHLPFNKKKNHRQGD